MARHQMVKCHECRKSFRKGGLASHRFRVHGIAGTSRWATKARKVKKIAKAPRMDRMEAMIRDNLKKPFFQEVLKEWALHVESAAEEHVVDATTFSNLFLEMLRDPRNRKTRQACTIFAIFMKPRRWEEALEAFGKIRNKDVRASFEKPEAKEFYKQFKRMVLEQVTQYWEQFLTKKQKSPRKRRVSVRK